MRVNSSKSRQFVKRLAQAGRLSVHATLDACRFWRYSSLSTFDSQFDQLSGRIMYNVHALEKSLAHTNAWQPGRGQKALRNLNDAMVRFWLNGYAEGSFVFSQGVSILRAYRDRHSGNEESINFLSEIVDPLLLDLASDPNQPSAGVTTVYKSDKADNMTRPFYELSQGRASVREFSGGPIDSARVVRAITNAEKTPSVCNRQGWNVYSTSNKALMRKVLAHQHGFDYPVMPEVLLVIAVSTSAYISPVERNQCFVDGGMYAMSVLYGLEAEGLAAVSLNACLYIRDAMAIRKLLQIGPSEEIVVFIAVGDHPEMTYVPASCRIPSDASLHVR